MSTDQEPNELTIAFRMPDSEFSAIPIGLYMTPANQRFFSEQVSTLEHDVQAVILMISGELTAKLDSHTDKYTEDELKTMIRSSIERSFRDRKIPLTVHSVVARSLPKEVVAKMNAERAAGESAVMFWNRPRFAKIPSSSIRTDLDVSPEGSRSSETQKEKDLREAFENLSVADKEHFAQMAALIRSRSVQLE